MGTTPRRLDGQGGVHVVRAMPKSASRTQFDATLILDCRPARLVVRGDLDLHTGVQLEELATPYAAQHLLVDLTDVEFLDSSGLNVLLSLHRKSAAAGGSLVVGPMSPIAEKVMQLTGALDHLRQGD